MERIICAKGTVGTGRIMCAKRAMGRIICAKGAVRIIICAEGAVGATPEDHRLSR